MAELLKADICVIGAGSGGLSVAAAAAGLDASVVLVEKGRMGGDCLNAGCIPSKSLIAAAERAHQMRTAAALGLGNAEPQVNFRRIHDHVHDVIAGIAPTDSAERFAAMGVTVIRDAARFEDRRTVLAGAYRIRARRVVLATGSRPAVPDIDGIGDVDYHTSETIFSVTRKPAHLVVAGAGPTGLELAQAYRRLGVQVTVVEPGTALSGEDPELSRFVCESLEADGVRLRTDTSILRVEPRRNGVRVVVDAGDGGEEEIDGSDLLLATGRRPNVDGLQLDKAGIRHDASGVTVDRRLVTSNARVYAIGDVAGGPNFTHVANYHAGVVVRRILFRLPARVDTTHVPRVTFTAPELAQVGLTEAEARRGHTRLRVLRWPYSENDRARTARATRGEIKVLAAPGGRILGAGIVGAHAGELIDLWAMAIRKKLTMRDMAEHVCAYPTHGDLARRVALEFYRPSLTSPWVRRMIGLMRLFG